MINPHAYDWRIDERPAPNFQRSEVIGQTRYSAPNTGEQTLSFTISFGDVPAVWTSPTCIAGIDKLYWNTGQCGLVFNKGPELTERPAMQSRSLAASCGCPKANALQVLKGYSASGVFRSFYDLLADYVVYVRSETTLLSRKLFEFAPGAIGLPFLQCLAQATMVVANRLDCFSLAHSAIAVHGDVGDSQIDTKKIIGINHRRFLNVANLMQVKFSLAINEIAFTVQSGQKPSLLFAADKRHLLPSVHRPDAHGPLVDLVGDQSVVERKGRMALKDALDVSIEFVGVGNLGEYSNGDICADVESLANRRISELVQGELSKGLSIPGYLADKVASGISGFKRGLERYALLAGRLQFELSDKFHEFLYTKYRHLSQERRGALSSAA